jgi:hypothetical protein
VPILLFKFLSNYYQFLAHELTATFYSENKGVMEKRSDKSIANKNKVASPSTEIVAEEGNPTWHLNPQPTADPADPLNWPMALKVRRTNLFSHAFAESINRSVSYYKSLFSQLLEPSTLRLSIPLTSLWPKSLASQQSKLHTKRVCPDVRKVFFCLPFKR